MDDLIKKAQESFKKRNYDDALNFYKLALKHTPNSIFIKDQIILLYDLLKLSNKKNDNNKYDHESNLNKAFLSNISAKEIYSKYGGINKKITVINNNLFQDKEDNLIYLNAPFFRVFIYADVLDSALRLTLESLVVATNGFQCLIDVFCDWDGADDNDLTLIEGVSVNLYKNKKKQGIYKCFYKYSLDNSNDPILFLRSGVIITKATTYSFVRSLSGDQSLLLVTVLNNCLPFIKCGIESGENVNNVGIKLQNLFGRGSFVRGFFPSVDCFLVKPKAFKIVPFPHWEYEQDSSNMSLVRWWQALIIKDIYMGVLLDAYAHIINPIITHNQILDFLDERYINETERFINQATELSNHINLTISSTKPVIRKPKTICFLLQSLVLGGGGLVIVNLVNQLILQGYDVRVYAKNLKENFSTGFNLLFNIRIYKDVQDIISDTPDNAVFVATLWTTARDVEAIVASKVDSRGYYYIQDYEPYFYDLNSRDEVDIKYRIGSADSYQANLQWIYTSDWIKRELDLNGHKSFRAPIKINVGIDHAVHPPVNYKLIRKASEKIVIGAMARPSTPRRGFELLHKSLSIVQKEIENVEIIFFGETDYDKYDLDIKITNAGIVEPKKIHSLYKSFDIFIDSSDFQGFGLCALEAMSAGCACVITDSGGISEYAIDGINSLVVNHHEQSVSSAILSLIKDVNLRQKISQAGIKTAKAFDIYNNTRSWMKVLDQEFYFDVVNNPGCAVIIPVYNNMNVVRRCLDSVMPTLREKDLLIIIDDASDQYTRVELEKYANQYSKIKLLINEKNLGFVGSSNRGMYVAKELMKDVILLNSDTIVPSGWIERMELAAYSQKKPAIVSPLGTESSHLSLTINPGDSFKTTDKWLQENVTPNYPEIITPEGWCFYLPQAIYQAIGFIDPIFGRGYCEESDLCMRAYVAGFGLRCCDNLIVYHQGKVSFGGERSSLYEKNRKIFDQRWATIYKRVYSQFIQDNPLSYIRALYKASAKLVDKKCTGEFNYLFKILDYHDIDSAVNILKSRRDKQSVGLKKNQSLAFLLPEFLPYGGVLSVVSLANDLVNYEVDVKIVVLKKDGYSGDNLNSLVTPIFLDNYSDFENFFPEVDMVVATGWITVYYAALLAQKNPKTNFAYYVQDFEADFPDVKTNVRLHKACLQTYLMGLPMFCKTKWIKDKLSEIGVSDIELVPPSLDLDNFYQRSDAEKHRICDILAMYRPGTLQRDPDTLLKVIRSIKSIRPETVIWLFGEESESQKLVEEGLIDKACGIVNHKDLPNLYSSSKVFLETSVFHGFGRTIAEAMACNTACVITNSGGPLDFVRHKENAFVCEVGDVSALTTNVISLLKDDDLRLRLAKNGRRSIELLNPFRSSYEIQNYLKVKKIKTNSIQNRVSKFFLTTLNCFKYKDKS